MDENTNGPEPRGVAPASSPSFEDALQCSLATERFEEFHDRGNLSPERQEELAKAAAEAFKSLNEAISGIAAEAMKPVTVEIEQALAPIARQLEHYYNHAIQTPSSDFNEELHPGVGQRFQNWFDSSPLTIGGNGDHTQKQLSVLLHISEPSASKYLKNPENMSQWAAYGLQVAMNNTAEGYDERPYYELIHGEGTYDAHVAELEKQADIREAAEFLQGKPPAEVSALVHLLKSNAETYEELYDGQPQGGARAEAGS